MRVREMIHALGGPTTVARALGLDSNAVVMWGMRDVVPAEHWIAVWRLAVEAGVDWRPPNTDGVQLVPEPAPRSPEAA